MFDMLRHRHRIPFRIITDFNIYGGKIFSLLQDGSLASQLEAQWFKAPLLEYQDTFNILEGLVASGKAQPMSDMERRLVCRSI